MPCYDGLVNNGLSGYEREEFERKIREAEEAGRIHEAAFCALANAVERSTSSNLFQSMLIQGSKSSGMDLLSYWEKHREGDAERMGKVLAKFSENEKLVIAKLLRDYLRG